MEVPGSFDSSMELNTPIKNLRLGSPSTLSPIYPNLDDILPSSSPPLNSYMQSLGYLRKISSNVLKELNQRASQISEKMKSPPSTRSHASSHRRRNKLESISSHYSVRNKLLNKYDRESAQNAAQESAQNSLKSAQESAEAAQSAQSALPDSASEYHHKDSSNKRESLIGSAYSKRRRTSNLAGEPNMIHLPRLSPLKQLSSPLKRISPSKKYNDLHSILTLEPEEKSSPVKFAVPKPPSRTLTSRPSVLQLAGVKPLPANHNSTLKQTTLSGSPSSKLLNNPASTKPHLQKIPIPVLTKTQSLKPKTSSSSLNHKTSAHSIPNPTHSYLSHSNSSHSYLSHSKPYSNLSQILSRSVPNLAANSLSHSIPTLKPAPKVKLTRSPTSKSLKAPTVPQPFLLYDKPTISSSQKSLDRFQKFKSKFK